SGSASAVTPAHPTTQNASASSTLGARTAPSVPTAHPLHQQGYRQPLRHRLRQLVSERELSQRPAPATRDVAAPDSAVRRTPSRCRASSKAGARAASVVFATCSG